MVLEAVDLCRVCPVSPCQGLGGMEGLAPWARAHGYIMPPRLGLKRKRGTFYFSLR